MREERVARTASALPLYEVYQVVLPSQVDSENHPANFPRVFPDAIGIRRHHGHSAFGICLRLSIGHARHGVRADRHGSCEK
jgi:hypothetical protein